MQLRYILAFGIIKELDTTIYIMEHSWTKHEYLVTAEYVFLMYIINRYGLKSADYQFVNAYHI